MYIKFNVLYIKEVVCSSNENIGQNSFKKIFFLILHMNTLYPSASGFCRKKGVPELFSHYADLKISNFLEN